MLSIIVPVRDESNTIKDIFNYFNDNLEKVDYEVLFINDFSNDDTLAKINTIIKDKKNFRVIDNTKKGLGGAINLGIKKSLGENIAIMMADQSDDINDLIKFRKNNKRSIKHYGTRSIILKYLKLKK